MDEFQSLSWRVSEPSVLDIGTNFIKEQNIVKTYVYKNNFKPYNFSVKKYDDTKPTTKIQKYPFKTNLNKIQQSQCLKALQLLELGRPLAEYSQQEQQLINIYNNLKLEIIQENKLFLNYLEKEWKNKYQQIKLKHKGLLTFLKSKWEIQLELTKKYDQFYKDDIMIPLSCNEKSVEIIYEGCVLELGNIALINRPTIPSKISMSTIPSLKALKENLKNIDELNVTKLSVSEDIYAENIAKQHNCDIIISSSGLKTLIDNYGPDYNTIWNLPVIIKEYDLNNTKKKLIFIDKALPQPKFDWRGIFAKCFKLLLNNNLCRNLAHSFEIPEIIKECYKSKYGTNNEICDTNDDEIITTRVTRSVNKQNLEQLLKKQSIKFHHNVSYRIWKLKLKSEQNALLKGSSDNKEIRILVRCKTNGSERDVNGLIKPVSITPKIEFQPDHGGELLTRSEILRQWTTLFFRPFSNLLRVRINSTNNEYMKLEEISLNKIINESWKQYNCSPAVHLNILHNVFAQTCKMLPGNYILHHTPKHGTFAAMMKSVDNQNCSFNLQELYKNKYNIDTFIKWNPIDTTLILPYHIEHGNLPGIFPTQFNKSWQHDNRSDKGKINKKTKKKKRK